LAADGLLAAAVAEQLALNGLVRADGRQVASWARRALAASPDQALVSNGLDTLAIGLALDGQVSEALALTADLPAAGSPEPGVPDGWVGRGMAKIWADDLAGAHEDLSAALAGYERRGGPLPWQLIGLTLLAETEFRLGWWDDAIGHADLAVSIVEDTGQDWLASLVHAVAALPLAGRGARESAAAHTSVAEARLRAVGTELSAVWVGTAKALSALADGERGAIVSDLEPLARITPLSAVLELGWPYWPALYAEACAAVGDWERAEALLVPFEQLVSARRRRSALAAAARARGAVEMAKGHPDRAERAFLAGLQEAVRLPLPLDRGLLEAAYGRLLRRTGRRVDAVAHLEVARTEFARLGARPFLLQCERELAACGRAKARGRPARNAALTPQELAVSRLVAAGRTNRQAAAELVVSVKTIEYHLCNAYAKLAVSSRTQLALMLNKD
jgi:DNA-binding CsgD family transcriptional regulator